MTNAPTLATAILLALGLLGGPLALEPEAGPPVPVPSVAVHDFSGQAVDLRDVVTTGGIVVLNFWATWCAPCKQEMPTLAALAERFEGEALSVVTIAVDRADPETLMAFMAELGAGKLPVLRDARMATSGPLAVRGLPITLVIDREGNEIFRHAGFADWAAPEMVAFFEGLLADKGA